MANKIGNFQRILVIKLQHHGDMLLITPVISTLKYHYPEAEIDILLYQETQPMLENSPDISRIFAIDRTWKKLGAKSRLSYEYQLLKKLRKRHYDLVLNLADQWRSAFITLFTGAPIRLGFDYPKRQNWKWYLCYTKVINTAQHHAMHTVEQNLSILNPLNLSSFMINVKMNYSEKDLTWVKEILSQHSISQKYIVIQPTSRWFFKCWDEKKMAEIIISLKNDGKQVILTSGPDEQEITMINNILSYCPNKNIISLAGQLTLPKLAALIDHAQLLIGVDSVPIHMAAALGTPCIALFGPSKLTLWRPWQAIGEVIWAGNYGRLPDPDDIDTDTNKRYLDLIPTEAVISSARRLLL
ncbi:putative lipopolysaccharide heptosyltransferase III [Photorhabdus asymbiotica]|uniref:putative lipopolysaccharide heptosyltransferase III n=1 Tax=Photorhabdus asymbiotica TaxID=291112 RepID=UPI003DA74263